MASSKPFLRQDLSRPGLIKVARGAFDSLKDHRRLASVDYPLGEVCSAALAMFMLKMPSMLAFEKATLNPCIQHNLGTLFGVNEVPSDSQLRTILDPVNPAQLRPAFRAVHSKLQRGNALVNFTCFGGKQLLAMDGTGLYSSTQVACPHCCVKNKKTGPEYYHQLVAAVLVHPDQKIVLPVDFEPITRADGVNKNDCERNASKRLIKSVAAQYPKRRFVVLEDALAANGPHVQTLLENAMDYIIVAKPGGNAALFATLQERLQQGLTSEWEEEDQQKKITRGYRICKAVPLNSTYPDLLVNTLEYWEIDSKGKERVWCWITNLEPTRENAEEFMRAGRSRWKIENETFNTLKNQGYHFEHNYGHGKQYLSSVLGGMCLLAFLIDQANEHACRVFRQALASWHTRQNLWETFRGKFSGLCFPDWETCMAMMADPYWKPEELPSIKPT